MALPVEEIGHSAANRFSDGRQATRLVLDKNGFSLRGSRSLSSELSGQVMAHFFGAIARHSCTYRPTATKPTKAK
ncbi:hypothetical protein [Laspinema olomoucense]|uniref:hypothetical protein n=1 Tax=Laspinema olomoucense TaxID=3231600 RepID=UPI0021BB2E23|nr:hypothetical protein [Laspinema sp. D3d]MCT7973703.1 hypothetical protein [Laspinema sp. D3d]